jgi:hypothetical protein
MGECFLIDDEGNIILRSLGSESEISSLLNKDNENAIETIRHSMNVNVSAAAYGDKVVASLNHLNNILNAISKAAKTTPYTMAIGFAIEALRPLFEKSIEEIESQHVTLD